MTSRFISLLAGFLPLVGCANPNEPIRTKVGNLTQEQVDTIVKPMRRQIAHDYD